MNVDRCRACAGKAHEILVATRLPLQREFGVDVVPESLGRAIGPEIDVEPVVTTGT